MSFSVKSNPSVPSIRFIPRAERMGQTEKQNKPIDKKVDALANNKIVPLSPPKTSERKVIEISGEDLAKLRYAQASMKMETSDGTPLEELTQTMLSRGFDAKHAINVVEMSPSKLDSPAKKRVAFDTRRTSAARAAAKHYLGDEFSATIKLHKKNELAPNEYEGLRHLTFKNNKIPHGIRTIWIKAWNTWHDDELLKSNNIVKGTWGHLIKLRMAMSTDPVRSKLALGHSGFKESPTKRKTRRPIKRKLDMREKDHKSPSKVLKLRPDSIRRSLKPSREETKPRIQSERRRTSKK